MIPRERDNNAFSQPLFTTLLAILTFATGDCVKDSNWNFGLVGLKTYYAAVPLNGPKYVFADPNNQCLDVMAGQCVPCKDLRYGHFFYSFDQVGKCIITSIPASSRKRADDMVDTFVSKNMEADDPTKVVSQALPAVHVIWSLSCGISLSS